MGRTRKERDEAERFYWKYRKLICRTANKYRFKALVYIHDAEGNYLESTSFVGTYDHT